MQTRLIHINDLNANKVFYMKNLTEGDTNDSKRQKMKQIVSKAIYNELTDIQKYCFTEHYLNGKKGKDIAAELGLNPSTVSRHICAARRKIKNIANYYS